MRNLVLLFIVVAVMFFNSPAVRAQETCPGGMTPTIASLEECVTHCLAVGHIDNAGVANSLLAKLQSAAAAESRGDASAAIAKLQAFIHEVEAQSGKHIGEEHADHLILHAEVVIAALQL